MAKTKAETRYKKGMSKEDIYRKLEGFKTDEGKTRYLKSVSSKSGLLKGKTKKSIYKILGDYSAEKGDFDRAGDFYEKAGLNKKAKLEYQKGLKDAEEKGDSYYLRHYAKKLGDEEKLNKGLSLKADEILKRENVHGFDFNEAKILYEKVGDKKGLKRAGDFMLKWATNLEGGYLSDSRFDQAGEVYEKSGDKEALKNFGDAALKDYNKFKESHNKDSWGDDKWKRVMKRAVLNAYEKSGNKDGLKKIAKVYFDEGDKLSALEGYEKAGDRNGIVNSLSSIKGTPSITFLGYKDSDLKKEIKGVWNEKAKEWIAEAPNSWGINNAVDYYKKAGLPEKKIKEILNELGDEKFKEGKVETAAEFYEEAGTKNKLKKVHEKIGDQLAKKGDYFSAAMHYEKAKSKEKLKESLLKAGNKSFEEGNFSHAADSYKKAGLKDKFKVAENKMYKKEAENLIKEKKFAEAAYRYGHIGTNDEKNNLLIQEGDKLMKKGSFESAERYYKEGGLSEKEIFSKIGNELSKKGDFKKASEYYEKAESKEKLKESLLKAGNKSFKEGNFSSALDFYEKSGLNKSMEIKDLELMSELYEKSGKTMRAMDMQRKIKRLKDKK